MGFGSTSVTIPGDISTALVVGTKTVTTNAASIFAGVAALSGRKKITICNISAYTVYVGPSDVTTSTGLPILPGDYITRSFDASVSTAIYAIAAASAEIRVEELK
jgi:hypothetical protein